MLIAFSITLVDVIILTIYTVLEGVMTHFSAGTQLNKERLRAVYGVS